MMTVMLRHAWQAEATQATLATLSGVA